MEGGRQEEEELDRERKEVGDREGKRERQIGKKCERETWGEIGRKTGESK